MQITRYHHVYYAQSEQGLSLNIHLISIPIPILIIKHIYRENPSSSAAEYHPKSVQRLCDLLPT